MLRIISGKYKGRKIEQPTLELTRPTTDRIKEAIFSIIQFKIHNAIVLDLFSGSGSLAIEALSRGAMKALIVENNKDSFKVIQKNLTELKINNVGLYNIEAETFLKTKKGTKYDLIFVDPPYQQIDLYNQSLQLIATNKMLNSFGFIILETNTPKKIIIPKALGIQKMKQYGKITILILGNI